MPELWDEICAAWDDELMTTEEIKRLADLLFPSALAFEVKEEIDLLELDIDVMLVALTA